MSLVHFNKRKRASGKSLHPYPARSPWLRILDRTLYVVGTGALLIMLPQLKLIYIGKDATGVEPITWITLAIFDIPWIIYGLVHKERPITVIYIGWFLVNALMFIGAILY